jgi:hypothetical protein
LTTADAAVSLLASLANLTTEAVIPMLAALCRNALRHALFVFVFLLWVPSAGAWTWPVAGPVVQGFSFDPAHPYAGGQHRGIDIAAPTDSPVVAPLSGVVSFAGTVPTSGKSVTIDTADGLSITLTHLGSIAVARDAAVAEGGAVGTIGPSGTPEVDGPYVHLGVRMAADPQGYLDPLGFLPVLASPLPPAPAPAPAADPGPVPAPVPAEPPAAPAPPAEALPPVAPPPPVESPAPADAPVPPAVDVPAVQLPTVERPVAEPPAAAPPVVAPVALAPVAVESAPVETVPPVVVDPPVLPDAPGEPVIAPDGLREATAVDPVAVPRMTVVRAAPRSRPAAGPPVGVVRASRVRPLGRRASLQVDVRPAASTTAAARRAHRDLEPAAALSGVRVHRAISRAWLVLALLAFGGLAAVCVAAARIIRGPSPISEEARPDRLVAEDPGCARVAVRERAAPHRPRGGLRRAGRRVRAVPPPQGQRRLDGERDGRARHAGDGVRRQERRVAA